MTRSFLRDGPVASMTRLQTRSSNRNRTSTSDDIVSGTPAALAQDENRLPFDPASLPAIESIGAESEYPRLPRSRGAWRFGACGASPRVVVRSCDPRLCRSVGELLGLQRAWRDGGLRTNRRGGSRAAFDAAVGRTGHNSRCGASACHIAAGRRLSEASRRIRSGRASSNQRGIGGWSRPKVSSWTSKRSTSPAT